MRRLILVLFSVCYSTFLFAGSTTYNSTTAGGDWNSGSTWVGGSIPGTSNSTINVNGSVYSNTSLSFNSNVNLTVSSNDTLIINGDLSLNSNNTFTIQSGSVVIVRGNFTSNSKLTLAADAYFIVTGDVTLNNNSTITSATTPSQIFVGGTANWGGATGNAITCSATDTTYTTGCNYGSAIDLLNDPISTLLNQSCTPQPTYYTNGQPTSNSPVATGNTISLSANPNPGTTSYTYYWTGPNNFSYSSTSTANTSISSATTSMTGYYTFFDLNSAGCYSKDSTYALVTNCGVGSAYFSRNNYTGTWSNVSSWGNANNSTTPLPPPTDGTSNGSTQTLSIHGFITLNGSYTVTSSNQYICDTLVITGDLNLTGNAMTIGPNGVLIVLGNFTGNSGTLINNGRMIFASGFSKPYSYTFSGSGAGYVFDTAAFSQGYTPTGNDSTLQANDPTLYSFYSSVKCGGAINGGTISSNQSLCPGDTAAPFTSVAAASPGTGFTYQWYSSPDSSTWTAISGDTSLTYNPGIVSQTSYYYRYATKGSGCSSNSNTLTISLYPTSSVTITGDTSACGSNTLSFSANSGFSSYSWTQDTTTTLGNAQTQNVTFKSVTPPANSIIETVSVKVTDTNGCNATASHSVTVHRLPDTGPQYHTDNIAY